MTGKPARFNIEKSRYGGICMLQFILGKKVAGTRVVPVTTKILTIFVLFILLSNFASNYINLIMNQGELIQIMKQILIKDLKESYNFCNTQYDIYQFNQDLNRIVSNMQDKAINDLKNEKAVLMGVKQDGTIFFLASKTSRFPAFTDTIALDSMKTGLSTNQTEGVLNFKIAGYDYFGVYKYQPKWDMFIVRAEELNEFYQDSRNNFIKIILIIAIIALFSVVIGSVILQRITKYIGVITNALMKMNNEQNLQVIDLKKAPNDDITYLGMSFNSLSITINNLLLIFRKFVNQDIVQQAYQDKEVRLEGSQQELTMLFSDIKSFTYMTETLGTDIIKLLNFHYDKAIREIVNYNGVIGSIIGDALLAVYGVVKDGRSNKSYEAIISGYKIQEVAQELRMEMHKRKEEIVSDKGALTEVEEKVYKAVLLEVGVGIDGGTVFYGNIGSYVRMTNTVIGDNVNSASRLEGLTRIYKVPMIVSEYVRDDVEKNVRNHGIYFLELDLVQVKGKTLGKRVYWPILRDHLTDQMEKDIKYYSEGLKLYYDGDWGSAYLKFKECTLPAAEVFIERTESQKAPKDWSGIWTMKTK